MSKFSFSIKPLLLKLKEPNYWILWVCGEFGMVSQEYCYSLFDKIYTFPEQTDLQTKRTDCFLGIDLFSPGSSLHVQSH